MKLPIKKEYFDQIKSGKKNIELPGSSGGSPEQKIGDFTQSKLARWK